MAEQIGDGQRLDWPDAQSRGNLRMHVVIVGAGIGGLTAGLALSKMDISSTILEAAPQLGEIGAGLQLGPNAFHVLNRLGVGQSLLKGAVRIDDFRLVSSASGDGIASIAFGPAFERRFGNPYAVIHRADLHQSLLNACKASGLVTILVNSKVFQYEQTDTWVKASCADGREVLGDALIGADGLNSIIRARLVGDGPPRVSGHTTYRSVVPTEQMPEEFRWSSVIIWVGPKTHVVHYPLKGGEVFNLVATAHDHAAKPVAGAPAATNEVRAKFAHLVPDVQRIIERGSNWKKWVLCDRDPIDNWCDGRVTLLGDAAHPTLQYYAQGACMAMEDGLCIAHSLSKHGSDIPLALTLYQQARKTRTARVQIGSRLIGDYVFHPDGAQAAVRDEVLHNLGQNGLTEAMAWLYDVGAATAACEPHVRGTIP